MDQYILIFRHQDAHKVVSHEQMQIWMEQTQEWIGKIAEQNKFEEGVCLHFDEARVVRANNDVHHGPFGRMNETIGGYIIINAYSMEEAVEFAKGCPILHYRDNSVEVRKLASN